MDLLKNIVKDCPSDVALMGMDIGKKTIGVAVSDSAQKIACPLSTIKRTKFSKDIKALEEIIREYNIGGYIMGYPLNMDGSEGRRCQSIRDFAVEFENQLSDDLKGEQGLWIAFWDERLSTVSVEDFVHEAVDISKRRAKEKGILDKLVAQCILQGALDFMRSVGQNTTGLPVDE